MTGIPIVTGARGPLVRRLSMLWMLVILVFEVPLVMHFRSTFRENKAREQRLSKIQERLAQKKIEGIERKRARIDRKHRG